jgi:sugar/nucleoside kinase (ribokinase family)
LPGQAELTLIANVALDRVNHGQPTCGGCPAFAPYAFSRLRAHGVINTACAKSDLATFECLNSDGAVEFRFLDAETTTRFDLNYSGEFSEQRTMCLHQIGHVWTEEDIDRIAADTEWVHLAPLLRSDFPVATIARLAQRGHRIGYDGQGLVRVPRIGELAFDAQFEPELLDYLTVLKLSEDETSVIAAEHGQPAVAEIFSRVPELIFTHGPRGAEVYWEGRVVTVEPDHVVADVQTTGAGDVFMSAYLIGRHRGLDPVAAAALSANVTAAMLTERKDESGGAEP